MSTLTPLDIMAIAQAEAYRRDALDHAPLEVGWDEGGLASYLWYLDRVVARLTDKLDLYVTPPHIVDFASGTGAFIISNPPYYTAPVAPASEQISVQPSGTTGAAQPAADVHPSS